MVVLALAAAATVAGMKGYTAIAGWVGDVPADVVAELYLRVGAMPAGWPSRTTIWRVCTDADAQALDVAVGAWLCSQLADHPDHAAAGHGGGVDAEGGSVPRALVHVRLHGKTVRGAKDADGDQLHLLAALAGPAGDGGAVVVVAPERGAGRQDQRAGRGQDRSRAA